MTTNKPIEQMTVDEVKSALESFESDLESYDDELERSVDLEFGNLSTTFGDLKIILDYFKNYPPLGWLRITDEQKDGRNLIVGGWHKGHWHVQTASYDLPLWRISDNHVIMPDAEPTHYFPINHVPVPKMEDKE